MYTNLKALAMYNYQEEKQHLFSDEGQRLFLKCRDRVKSLLATSGAVRMQEALQTLSGSNWTMLACLDRMIELGEIREIQQGNVAGQHRVFVAN